MAKYLGVIIRVRGHTVLKDYEQVMALSYAYSIMSLSGQCLDKDVDC